MKKIKLMIDIYEEVLEGIVFKNKNKISLKPSELAILHGTPLPKHHGRLKDVDAFIAKVKADRKHSAYLRSWTADDVLSALDNSYAPTIIEADGGEEDEGDS